MTSSKFNIEHLVIGGFPSTLVNGTILVIGKFNGGELTPYTLGGKGHSLCVMTSLGLSVPKAVILPTAIGRNYINPNKSASQQQKENLERLLHSEDLHQWLEMDRTLCSVRSGAKVSMAGMMDTILNVGIMHHDTYKEILHKYKNPHFAIDCKQRFLKMYNESVLHRSDPLDEDVYRALTLSDGSETVAQHYVSCVDAVFKSWFTPRAIFYRKMTGIADDSGTACIIQQMVFGNISDTSCTGVVFSRDPTTGDEGITGEYLVKAQGEDIVSGVSNPSSLTSMWHWNKAVYKELHNAVTELELNQLDVQDIEFTVENGKLYLLQARSAKRTATASLKIFKSLYTKYFDHTGDILVPLLLRGLDLKALHEMTSTFVTSSAKPAFSGIGVCTGALQGILCATEEEMNAQPEGSNLIFFANETTPKDLPLMSRADAILTTKGGSTCHAAVVARSMGKPCIVGVTELHEGGFNGSSVTLCGLTGRGWLGSEPIEDSGSTQLADFAEWLCSKLGVTLIDNYLTIEKLIHATRHEIPTGQYMVSQDPDEMIDEGLAKAARYIGISGDIHSVVTSRAKQRGVIPLDNRYYTDRVTTRKVRTLTEFAASPKCVDLSDSSKAGKGFDQALYSAIAELRSKVYGMPVSSGEGHFIPRSKFLKLILCLKIKYP
ncbi:MAG: PEP/pyruvate-binding domain-containing protein [Bacteroidaceae bacterium]